MEREYNCVMGWSGEGMHYGCANKAVMLRGRFKVCAPCADDLLEIADRRQQEQESGKGSASTT